MTFKDGFELSLVYHEGVLNLYMFGEHELKVSTSFGQSCAQMHVFKICRLFPN